VTEAIAAARAAGFSRFPVEGRGPDEMAGFVEARDLLGAPPRARLRHLARPLPYVPEVKPALELLEEFRRSGGRMALVVDEHGHLAGLVTLTDLLEEIFGEMIEPADRHKVLYERLEGGRVLIPARMEIRFFNEEFGADLEASGVETMGGLLLERLGRIPATGEELEIEGLRVRVRRAEPHRLVSLEVHLPRPEETGEEGP
jgi:CBS domain containing-hemolysin-like protein